MFIRSWACFKAKSSNKKCMSSNIDETNGIDSSQALYAAHNFGRRDNELAVRKMQLLHQFWHDCYVLWLV